jgi:hypothetical protein
MAWPTITVTSRRFPPPWSALQKEAPRQQPTGRDLSRLQKADFLPPLGNLIFTQIVQAVFALGI